MVTPQKYNIVTFGGGHQNPRIVGKSSIHNLGRDPYKLSLCTVAVFRQGARYPKLCFLNVSLD